MKSIKLSALLISILLTGCVTGTRYIELDIPDRKSTNRMSGSIYINTIDDLREFEAKPKKPSTPSVNGDLENQSKQQLSTLIGRQRNSYGKAMGDIQLSNGESIQDKMKSIITKGLEGRGYTVVDDPSADKKLNVSVEKFWAWFSPGMFSVSFEANLQCKVDIEDAEENHSFNIQGYGKNKGQVASDENWALAYQRAITDFLNNLDQNLNSKGL